MKITRHHSTPTRTGTVPDNFTGDVRIDTMTQGDPPSRVGTAAVTFAAGARTVWHTHPAGQTIVITAGSGRVQREGGPVEEVGVGDVVFFQAGERHWHGAGPDESMTHVAITETIDGAAVDWLEPVTDAQYAG